MSFSEMASYDDPFHYDYTSASAGSGYQSYPTSSQNSPITPQSAYYSPPSESYPYGQWFGNNDATWAPPAYDSYVGATEVPQLSHSSVPLYAPVPMARQAANFSFDSPSSQTSPSDLGLMQAPCSSARHDYPSNTYSQPATQQQQSPPKPSLTLDTSYDPFAQFCATVATASPLMTFPTPSEMLSSAMPQSSPMTKMQSCSPPSTSTVASSTSTAPATVTPAARPYSIPDRNETARKARRRAMTQSIGFTPTDPDSISSHEKKRHYLECLEKYVIYLHDQIRLVGSQPVPMERVATYRGMSSRSIRTLLVHMENTTRKLNMERIAEEQRFLTLRDTLLKQQATAEAFQQLQDSKDIIMPQLPADVFSSLNLASSNPLSSAPQIKLERY